MPPWCALAARGVVRVREQWSPRLRPPYLIVTLTAPVLFSATPIPDRTRVVVAARGDLDLTSAHVLEDQVRDLQAVGWTDIVVSLRDVPFIDSTGLRVLLVVRNAVKRAGGRLALVEPPATAQRIFDLTATRTLFAWVGPQACLQR